MENFFYNLHSLLINGKNFITRSVNDTENKNILSFSVFTSFLIGAFHVFALLTVFKGTVTSTAAVLFFMVAGAVLYTAVIFAKSALFYYLTGLYKKDEKPVRARSVLKVFTMTGYAFYLLPAAGLLSSLLNSTGFFIFFYLLLASWVTVARYRALKNVLKTHEFIFKLTYAIPVLAQIMLVIAIIAFAALSNLFIIKTLIQSIVKTVMSLLSAV